MPAAASSAIALTGASLGYRGRTVLDRVSLQIPQGAFVGLLGANGAGKTTLLRALLGLVRPQAGGVQVLGQPASRGNPGVGYMPQARAGGAGPRILGQDYVASAATRSGQSHWGLPWLDRAARREVAWALDMVGAAALARRPLAELSGGERQRLLLAQALLGRPRLLLLDEPLISLDPRHQQGVVQLVKRLQTELELTVVFSAHELNPLLGALDQVLYLGAGQAAIGSVDEVITGPVLSRLYGTPIEVVRADRRIFILLNDGEAEHEAHRHEHHHAHHGDAAHVHV